MAETTTQSTGPQRLRLTIDYRWIIGLLLLIIIAMLAIWKPWHATPNDNSRTITVTGDTTIKAEPDEFVFTPNYQIKNVDNAAALAQVSKQSDDIVSHLKQLGVSDAQIKTSANGYQQYPYYFENTDKSYVYTFQPTITLNNKELAQKVQDYLVTTNPTGEVTPQANFSDAKRRQLESQARDDATKDARSKAEQSAKNLGFKIGKVKSVEDGTNNFNQIYPPGGIQPLAAGSATDSKLMVQPGQNDLDYSVTVVYYLK